MKTNAVPMLLAIGCVVALLSSCATAAGETPATPVPPTTTPVPPTITPAHPTATPAPPPVPASCEEVEGVCLDLTFDGESCIYDGPTEVASGSVTLLFHNKSEGSAAVNFLMLLEERTIEDVIEYNGEEPFMKHHPSWSRELGTWRPIASGGGQEWQGNLEPGEYFMVCARMAPLGGWLGTGLTAK